MSDNDVCMPLHIGDYLADTLRLNTEQHGAYLLLLMECWRSGPPPANDLELAGITRLDLRGWQRNKRALLRFFSQREGRLVHQRIEEELAKARRNRSVLRARAVKGAQARWAGRAAGKAQGSSQAVLEHDAGPTAMKPARSPSASSSLVPATLEADLHEAAEPLLSLVTNTGKMFHVDHGYVRRLQGEFPAVDVAQQFLQMQAWVNGNPRNRKTGQGMTRFIGNWMSRAQDRAVRQGRDQGVRP